MIHFSENLFLIMWGEMRIAKDGILRITEVGGPRKIRQESHVQLTVDIPIKPGQRVVTIPKDNLEDGRTYIMQVKWSLCNSLNQHQMHKWRLLSHNY